MKRSSAQLAFNPLLIWTELAWKTGEMMLASAQVIGHRTGRMAAAGTNPSARDRREFALMGQEKLDASAESARAMGAQLMMLNAQLGLRALSQMLAGATAMMSLAGSRTPAEGMARHARLVRAMTESIGTASQLSGAAARLAHRGLKPIHARATANARRLAGR